MRQGIRFLSLLMLTAVLGNGGAIARPYTPPDDGIVLERLPEKSNPALAELKRQLEKRDE